MFDRADICEAYYLFAANWHGGQFSKIYRIFGRLDKIGFRPGLYARIATASDEVKYIYGALVRKHFPSKCGWQRKYAERLGK